MLAKPFEWFLGYCNNFMRFSTQHGNYMSHNNGKNIIMKMFSTPFSPFFIHLTEAIQVCSKTGWRCYDWQLTASQAFDCRVSMIVDCIQNAKPNRKSHKRFPERKIQRLYSFHSIFFDVLTSTASFPTFCRVLTEKPLQWEIFWVWCYS